MSPTSGCLCNTQNNRFLPPAFNLASEHLASIGGTAGADPNLREPPEVPPALRPPSPTSAEAAYIGGTFQPPKQLSTYTATLVFSAFCSSTP